jgi:hypothetical protein
MKSYTSVAPGDFLLSTPAYRRYPRVCRNSIDPVHKGQVI